MDASFDDLRSQTDGPRRKRPDRRERRALILAALTGLLIVLPLVRFEPSEVRTTWGWDESMHAALPAARIALAPDVSAATDALLGCSQYPFGFPLVLAVAQAIFGVSEAVARTASVFLWCLTLAAVAVCARRIARERQAPERTILLWIFTAVALASITPLAWRYARTLFLEIPFVCAASWTLAGWLGRRRERPLGFDVATGVGLALTFFTKFNYGVLFVGALAADAAVDHFLRRARLPARRWAALTLPLGVACLWWFVLPLPGGLARAAEHRDAFASFLAGNTAWEPTALGLRALHVAFGLSSQPLGSLAVLCAVLLSLRRVRQAGVQTLWLVLLAIALPSWLHPFHLDRFLVPQFLPVWLLAVVGLSTLPNPLHSSYRGLWYGGLAALGLLLAIATGIGRNAIGATLLGGFAEDAQVRAYQQQVLTNWSAARDVPTAGLEREAAERLYDAIAERTSPTERLAWLAQSSEVSPAALHLALLERGGSVERFLRDATGPMDLTPVPGDDPGDALPDLASFLTDFDAAILCSPPDLKGRGNRAWTEARIADPLLRDLRWEPTRLLTLEVARPPGAPHSVDVFLYRRP